MRLFVLLAGCALVLVGGLLACGPSSGSDDGEENARELRATRDRLIATLTPVVHGLQDALSARLKASQGNHDSCEHNLSQPTGFRYNINGRLDLDHVAGDADLEAATRVLEGAGFTVTAGEPGRVDAETDGLTFGLSTVSGGDFLLFLGGSDTCYEVGEDLAGEFMKADPNPIQTR